MPLAAFGGFVGLRVLDGAPVAPAVGCGVGHVDRLAGAKASMILDPNAALFDTDLDAVAVDLDAAIKAAAEQADRDSISAVAAGPLPAGAADSMPPANG